MIKKIILSALAFFAIGHIQAQKKRVLICDLGGIFFDLDGYGFGMAAAGTGSKLAGIGKTISMGLLDRVNPKNLEQRLFAVLHRFPIRAEEGFKPACKTSGAPMPYPICAYQAGRHTSNNLRAMATETCDRLHGEGFFISNREEEIIRNVIERMFTPAFQAQFNYTYPRAIELLKQVAESGLCRIEALSNWDRESFEYVRLNFPKECSYFDDIVLSGNINTVKPNNGSFQYMLDKLAKLGFTKEDCMFIDDQKENIEAARAMGIPSIQVKKGDSHSLALALYEFGLLPQKPTKSFFAAHKGALLYSAVAIGGFSIAYGLWSMC